MKRSLDLPFNKLGIAIDGKVVCTVQELIDALEDATAHLAGAASAYEKYARQYKVRGPTDPFFKTRKRDFEQSVDRARRMCRKLKRD